MSNLGLYQEMTKIAKKVGGPINLFLIVAAGGYAVIRPVESAVKAGWNKHKFIKQNNSVEGSVIYTVSKDGKSNEGLIFTVGDTFRVLERDDDAVLIEKIGDANNPYFVAYEFLKSISNYQ